MLWQHCVDAYRIQYFTGNLGFYVSSATKRELAAGQQYVRHDVPYSSRLVAVIYDAFWLGQRCLYVHKCLHQAPLDTCWVWGCCNIDRGVVA